MIDPIEILFPHDLENREKILEYVIIFALYGLAGVSKRVTLKNEKVLLPEIKKAITLFAAEAHEVSKF